jgi:hypothetical protein
MLHTLPCICVCTARQIGFEDASEVKDVNGAGNERMLFPHSPPRPPIFSPSPPPIPAAGENLPPSQSPRISTVSTELHGYKKINKIVIYFNQKHGINIFFSFLFLKKINILYLSFLKNKSTFCIKNKKNPEGQI